MRYRVYPYKQGSRSASVLAEALGGKVLKVESSKFAPRRGDVIINWGSSQCAAEFGQATLLNKPEAIAVAGNKLRAFSALKDANVSVPAFASRGDGVDWEGLTVCRHKLTGHSGEGIELADAASLPNAPLYVQYVPKKDEYRIHVVGESIIIRQRKARNPAVEQPNWKVRNHDNGFIFVRGDVNPPGAVEEQALAAIKALGLEFGAVDVIWNAKQERAYVLEVNCAPGLEGSSPGDYAEAFRALS